MSNLLATVLATTTSQPGTIGSAFDDPVVIGFVGLVVVAVVWMLTRPRG